MAITHDSAAAARMPASPVPARRIVRVALRRDRNRLAPLHVRTAVGAAGISKLPVFLTRHGRQTLISRLWISVLLSIWAVLMIYAGRDGIKPQDPATAVPMPHMIRK